MSFDTDATVRSFGEFWQFHFPEYVLDRERTLKAIHDRTDGMTSTSPDAQMRVYQDRVAAVYGAYELVQFQFYTLGHILTRITFPVEHLVSLGCGPASCELWLLSQGWVRRVTLVDHSPAMLARAKQIAQAIGRTDRVTTICRDATDSRLPTNSADLVFSLNAMHWSANWPRWIDEACRVCKRGQRVFLTCSLAMPRSRITPETLANNMRVHCLQIAGGLLVPPTEVGGGQMAVSSRCFATGVKKGR